MGRRDGTQGDGGVNQRRSRLARSGDALGCSRPRTTVRIVFVQEAFGTVLVVVVVLATIVAVIAIAGSGRV